MDDWFSELEEEGVQGVFQLLGRPVTAYALCLAGALILGVILLWALCREKGLKGDTALTVTLLALPLGLLCARAFYCAARISFFDSLGMENILYLWDGGYALWGAAGGAALAAVIAAKMTKQPLSRLLDAMAPAGALVIALTRLAEYFTSEGRGPVLENERFFFFPVGVYNDAYEEWRLAVFFLEALAALAILAVLLRRERDAGDTARLFLILYSACQVVLESLRRDDCLRWMFVRVSQLTAVIVLALLMLFAALRRVKAKRFNWRRTALWVFVFFACIGLVIWMEFAQDKSPDLPVWLCYVIMAAACVGLGEAAYQVTLKE